MLQCVNMYFLYEYIVCESSTFTSLYREKKNVSNVFRLSQIACDFLCHIHRFTLMCMMQFADKIRNSDKNVCIRKPDINEWRRRRKTIKISLNRPYVMNEWSKDFGELFNIHGILVKHNNDDTHTEAMTCHKYSVFRGSLASDAHIWGFWSTFLILFGWR